MIASASFSNASRMPFAIKVRKTLSPTKLKKRGDARFSSKSLLFALFDSSARALRTSTRSNRRPGFGYPHYDVDLENRAGSWPAKECFSSLGNEGKDEPPALSENYSWQEDEMELPRYCSFFRRSGRRLLDWHGISYDDSCGHERFPITFIVDGHWSSRFQHAS